MAKALKGITVEFDGNLTPLNKKIDESVKTIGSVGKELKEVNKLLKLDPTNTTLLTQKQELLKQAIAASSDKLGVLKQAQEQVNQLYQKGEIGEEKYREFAREIEKAEVEIKSYARQAEITEKNNKDLADSFSDAGKKVSELADKTKVASAASAGIITGSILIADKVDEGFDSVIMKTGVTGESAHNLRDIYDQIASETPHKFADIGNAIGEINTRLLFQGDQLRSATEDFLEYARVNNQDVETSVRLVSRAMGDASIPADEYKTVLDALTRAGQVSGAELTKLTDNIAKYGAPMRALGYDTNESIAMFAKWEATGVNTEIAMSGMKKAIASFSAEGKDAKEEINKVITEIEGMGNTAEAQSLAMEVFGQKTGSDLADAISSGKFSFQEYVDLIESSGGVLSDTYNELYGPMEEVEKTTNNFKIAATELGTELFESLVPAIDTVCGLLEDFTDWYGSLDPAIKTVITTVLLFIAVLTPILGVAGSVCAGISSLIGVLGLHKTATDISTASTGLLSGALNFLAANPAILVVAAIAGIIAVLVDLWNNSEEFRSALESFDQWIMNIFTTDWSKSFGIVGEIINVFFANFENIYEAIKKILSGIIDFVNGVFSGDWELAWKGISEIFGGIFDGLKALALAPINAIIGILNMLIDGVNWVIDGINQISFDAPEWLGGGHVGFDFANIDKIEYLAKGGLAYGPVKALIGEYAGAKNNPEVVAPLSKLKEMLDSEKKGDTYITMNLSVDVSSIKDIEDLIRIAKQVQQRTRMGGEFDNIYSSKEKDKRNFAIR